MCYKNSYKYLVDTSANWGMIKEDEGAEVSTKNIK